MRLDNINKTYHNKLNDVHVLKDLNFTLNTVGLTFIIGKSGSGKTTLLNILAGRDHDYTGTMILEGNVEYVEQEYNLMESLSVFDNLFMLCKDKKMIDLKLRQFGLFEHEDKKVKKLSTGQKKRVQVLKCLLSHPDLLICDEPTAALDAANSKLVMEALKEAGKNIPVLIVSHDKALCNQYASRICKLENGYISEDKIISEQKEYHLKQSRKIKRPVKEYLYLIKKMIISRPGDSLIKAVIMSLLIFSLYAGINFFSSVSGKSDAKYKWITGENLLITIGNEENKSDENETTTSYQIVEPIYSTYDFYTKQDVKNVLNEVDEVIGYRAGWDTGIYDWLNYLPRYTYDEAKKVLETADPKRPSTQKLAASIELFESQGGPEHEIRNEKIFVYFYGYNGFKDCAGYYPNDLIGTSIYFNNLFYLDMVVYQMKNDYQFSLLYGNQMKSDDEIIISLTVADELLSNESVSSYEDLIGKELDLVDGSWHPYECLTNFETCRMGYDMGSHNTYKIAGITDHKNNYENQVYLRNGVYDKWIEENYQMNPKHLEYQYAYYLIDPESNSDEISSKIDEISASTDSHYVSYASNDKSSQEYNNPILYWGISMIMIILVIMVMIGYEILSNRRLKKEGQIIKEAGYKAKRITFMIEGISIITGVIVWLILLQPLIEKINEIAFRYEYSEILTFNLSDFGISIILAIIMMLLIKGISYEIRIRRN
ncbi:ATP-binding cassette domain-containing protein [uncultured Thomasclavelia sp.]|uniref:ATP-binding cassette domain-containing protein n=1 Tax=uncultured Thomasclavelia sp. TaxID=3025759 RepID=UPI00260C4A56|nr:ATP-binding cassette domain-containing protein [uncultured Thomasclavelia sp.]